MSRLPRITGKELVRALKKAGFVCKRIEGSHHILILRKSRLNIEQFNRLR